MSQVDLGKFACDACNRQYPWKPDYAGRQVKCKCGAVMTAPTEAPNAAAAPAEDDDLLGGLYDLAEQEQQAAKNHATVETGFRCPSCQSDIAVGSAVCPSCNFNLKTGMKQRAQRATAATGAPAGGSGNPMLAYAGMNKHSAAQVRADNANATGGSMLTEMYVPAAAVLAGLIANIILYGYAGGAWRGLGYALPSLGVALISNLVLSFIGLAIAGKTLELSFGAPGPAALKLVALCLLPPAIAAFIGNLIGADSAFVRIAISTMLMTPLLVGGFIWLFQFAADEAMYCTVVIWLVNKWAVTFLVAGLLTGSIGGTSGSKSPTAAMVKEDETAAEMVERPNATEAKIWLNDSVTRMYAGDTHDGSLTLVTALYDAGAKKCTTLSASGEGYALIVQLPSRDAARKKVFAVIQQRETADKVPPEDQTTDEGQAYHTFQFGRQFP